ADPLERPVRLRCTRGRAGGPGGRSGLRPAGVQAHAGAGGAVSGALAWLRVRTPPVADGRAEVLGADPRRAVLALRDRAPRTAGRLRHVGQGLAGRRRRCRVAGIRGHRCRDLSRCAGARGSTRGLRVPFAAPRLAVAPVAGAAGRQAAAGGCRPRRPACRRIAGCGRRSRAGGVRLLRRRPQHDLHVDPREEPGYASRRDGRAARGRQLRLVHPGDPPTDRRSTRRERGMNDITANRSPTMKLYPLFADLHGLPVLVVGGGGVARRKAEALLGAGAQVTVGAPRLDAELAAWAEVGTIRWQRGEFVPGWLDGMWLVIAATDERELNAAVAAAASERRLFANVVDDAAHSRFHVPAVVDRSPLVVAVSTAGAAPALARRVRETLERVLDHGLGALVALAQRQRARIVRRHENLADRRAFYDWLHDGPVLPLLRAARGQEAEQVLLAALQGDGPPRRKGSVTLVGAGPGHPGLLTLQALRAINEADVVLHDQLVGEAILAMVRRDAERIDVGKRCGGRQVAQEQIHRLMLAHAREGRR